MVTNARLDLLGLEAFLAVAEHGSFNKAAQGIGITQTALSHRLRKFEDQLGITLITRTTRALALTPAGLDLLPKARQLLATAESVLQDIESKAAERRERLAIGCLPTVAMHLLPDVLREFSARHPAVSVRVFDNSAGEIASLVEAGEAEFGITIHAADRWDLDAEILAREPYVLVCHKDNPLARQRFATWTQLAGVPLIRISSRTGNRLLIDTALGNRKERMTWTHEVQHVASAVALVESGIGVTVVPRIAVGPAPRLVVAVPLRAPSVARTLVVVKRRGVPLSPPARHLRDLIGRRLTRVLKKTDNS